MPWRAVWSPAEEEEGPENRRHVEAPAVCPLPGPCRILAVLTPQVRGGEFAHEPFSALKEADNLSPVLARHFPPPCYARGMR